MAFVYEINGQQVEFDREPTDADIDEAARSLGAPPSDLLQAPPQPQEYALGQAVMSGVRPAVESAIGVGKYGVETAKNIADIGRNMLNWTPEAWKEVVSHPVQTAKAYVQTMPAFRDIPGQTTGQMVRGGVGQLAASGARALGSMVAAPESVVTMPYTMAAYEQEKIRQNPQAPGLEFNPYAQTVRGEAATQGRAGAANQMRTVANQPYGNVNPQERAILDQDRMMRQNIRKRAYDRVMGPVAPGTF